MPQLDKFIFFSQLFWLALLLGLLYLLLAGWFLPRLLRSLKFRRVHRGRLFRLAGLGGQRLVRLLPALAVLTQRSASLLVPALDRPLSQLAVAQASLRRWLQPAPPLRSFPLRAGRSAAELPLPVLPVFWSAPVPLPSSVLLPLLFRSSWSTFPPLPRFPLSPQPQLLPLDFLALVSFPAPVALLTLALSQRLVQWELFLWLDPVANQLPLEEFGLTSLRRLVRSPLVQLPSLL